MSEQEQGAAEFAMACDDLMTAMMRATPEQWRQASAALAATGSTAEAATNISGMLRAAAEHR